MTLPKTFKDKENLKNQETAAVSGVFAFGKNAAKGFTLIEVLVTLGVFIFIASFALGIGLDTFARTSINDERDTAIFLLSKARARALNNINESAHGFRVNGDNFVIFEVGPPEVTEETSFNDNFTITGGPVIFEQLTGRSVGGEKMITIAGTGGPKIIIINSEGAIIW